MDTATSMATSFLGPTAGAIAGPVLVGVVAGAAIGAAAAAITGKDILKGALVGAAIGGVTTGLGAFTGDAAPAEAPAEALTDVSGTTPAPGPETVTYSPRAGGGLPGGVTANAPTSSGGGIVAPQTGMSLATQNIIGQGLAGAASAFLEPSEEEKAEAAGLKERKVIEARQGANKLGAFAAATVNIKLPDSWTATIDPLSAYKLKPVGSGILNTRGAA